jgi:hypothetical protein
MRWRKGFPFPWLRRKQNAVSDVCGLDWLQYKGILNSKHEIPALAEAASCRQAKLETSTNFQNANELDKNQF